MFGQAQQRHISPAEYLERERAAEERSEYVNGQVFAMSGASRHHEALIINLGSELHQQLKRRGCQTYGSNLRVWIPAKKSFRYPDLSVVCGATELLPDNAFDNLLNPTVLIEILSPSTEATDRGAKTEEYRSLPSLQEYLLVAQDRCHVEHYVRQSQQQWLMTEYNEPDATIVLASIECQLLLADVYDKLVFPSEAIAAEAAIGESGSGVAEPLR